MPSSAVGDVFRTSYFYARTRLPLTTDAKLLGAILKGFLSEKYVLKLKSEIPWTDGVVIRFITNEDVTDIIDDLRPRLDELDMWAFHDGVSVAWEPHGGGPVGMYLGQPLPERGAAVVQVFVRYSDRDRDTDATADKVKAAIGEGARRVFHFRNGGIFMVRSDQPTGLIARRLERLHKVLHSAAAAGGCDLETREVLSADTDCWWQLP